ncbi:sugar-binding transcriptional regulator [Bifidobacterium aquikefiricola]|uniref:Sugar-binding domain-containing protein n=1 Tax=Bifidobacterium aquikefiricola TaxID=3059038 RepID=A0AB39U6R4_9BIFI
MSERSRKEVERRELMASIARAYYLEGHSRIEIGQQLGISRHRVGRMLDEAREEGMVSITINDEGFSDPLLSERLAKILGLRSCHVIRTHGNQDAVRDQIGNAAATLLSSLLHDGEVLGLTWGRTLTALASHLRELPRLTVVQLTGTLSADFTESPIEIVRKTSQYARGAVYPIFAPMIVGDEHTARILKANPAVSKAFQLFPAITTAVLSVGCWDPPDTQIQSLIDDDIAKDMARKGCIADIAGILVNEYGEMVDPSFQRRCVSINYEELNSIPQVIAVAGGALKAPAIQAVSRAGIITDLVTDDALATAILER